MPFGTLRIAKTLALFLNERNHFNINRPGFWGFPYYNGCYRDFSFPSFRLFKWPIIIIFTIAFFNLPFKFSKYKRAIDISYRQIKVDNKKFKWEEIKSFEVSSSGYVDFLKINLRGNKKSIRLAALTGKKEFQDFYKFKNRFLTIVHYHNTRGNIPEIVEGGFFTTVLAKVLFSIVGVMGIVGLITLFKGKVNNPVPVLMLLGLFGIVAAQIFKKRKTKANK